MGLTDNWQMVKILTGDWQIAENLTDYWHLPWVLVSPDKGPDCRLFSIKPVFKALNSIVPLFSADNVIKCAFLGAILAARCLSVIFRQWFYCKTHVCHVPCCKWPMISNLRSSEWLLRMRAFQRQFQVLTEMIHRQFFLVFSRSTSQYYTC